MRNFYFQTLQHKFLILREMKDKFELIFLEISKSLQSGLSKIKTSYIF